MATRINHLLSTRDLDLGVAERLFARTAELRELKGVLPGNQQCLRDQVVTNLFWEASTRTRVSFEVAARRLGGHVVNLTPKESSALKGETLDDTLANLYALSCRLFVIRHSTSGEIARLTENVPSDLHLVSGGDGTNEHPSQALLDAFTILEQKKDFKGLQVAIIGDIRRSRVARSNVHLLTRLGAFCRVTGPKELLPERMDVENVQIVPSVEEAIKEADVVMMLRIQQEREGMMGSYLTKDDYHSRFGLISQRLSLAKPDAIVMHPGPMIRDLEIASEIADGPQSVVLRQVENGLYMRMAIFEAVLGELG